MAGVNVEWYTRLEQGHDKSSSASVMDAPGEPAHVRVQLAELLN